MDGTDITSDVSVQQGKDIEFAASPATNYRVKEWKLNGTVIDGNTTTSYTITNLIGAATVTVEFEEILPTANVVIVSPDVVSVKKGGTKLFTATVIGTNSPDQAVTWTVEGGVSGTSITADGVFTVSSVETAVTLIIRATSDVDDTKSGTAEVTVLKADGATVDVPTEDSKTHNSITVSIVTTPSNGQTVEYAIGTNDSVPGTWQESPIFGNLDGSTTYYVFARSKENDHYNAGTYQLSAAITTLPTPSYGITLSESGTYTFTGATEGYEAQTPLTVTVTNCGDQPTGALTIGLSGANADSFILSKTYISDIAATDGDNEDTFTVAPQTGLAVGSYTATITVSGGNGISESFNVRFTVNGAETAFVPVTDITGVPDTATMGTTLLLTGTVIPNDATNKAILWSVKDARTTGVVINGNILSTAAAGTVTVTATIVNGLTASADYTHDFEINIKQTYTLTINAGTGGSIVTGTSGQYEQGAVISIAASSNNGFTFNGWTSSNSGGFDNQNRSDTTFTMPDNATAVTAHFIYTGGSGSSGYSGNNSGGDTGNSGNNGISNTPETPEPTPTPDDNTADAGHKQDRGKVTVSDDKTKEIIDKSVDNTAVIDLSKASGANSATIPKSMLNSIKQAKLDVELILPVGSIKFSQTAAGNIVRDSQGSSVTVSINKVESGNLNQEQAEKVGDRPVYELTVVDANKRAITNFGGNVEVTLPYTLKSGENPNSIVIYYISANGTLYEVPNCRYENGIVIFTTTHFSKYMIGYNRVTFTDVKGHWGQKVIEQAASRKLVTGYGDGLYKPNASVTRAEFVTMISNVLVLLKPKTTVLTYADVSADKWFYPYVTAAKRAGLLNGFIDDDNAFKPNEAITRQEIALILANVAEVYSLEKTVEADLKVFTDLDGIDKKHLTAISTTIGAGLLDANGISGDKFAPTGITTRAQAAKIQMNLLTILGKLD